MAGSTIKISIIGNARDAVKALRDTRQEADKTQKSINGASTSLGIFGQVSAIAASRVGLWTIGILAAVKPAFLLAGALAPLVGLLVALPAALLGATSLFGAFSLATSGVGAAISAGFVLSQNDMQTAEAAHTRSLIAVQQAQNTYNKVLKNAKSTALDHQIALEKLSLAQANVQATTTAYSKALSLLTPAARKFVTTIIGLRPQYEALKSFVSASFFGPFTDQIRPLATKFVPLLAGGLGKIAKAMGEFVSHLVTAVSTSKPLREGLAQVFGNTAAGIGSLDHDVKGLVDGFGNLLIAGAPVLRKIGTLTDNVAGRFSKWLDTNAKAGNFTKWLHTAEVTVGKLWKISTNLFGILSSIFSVGTTGSGSFLDNISKATGEFDDFLHNNVGRNDLRQFFQDLTQFVGSLWFIIKAVNPLITGAVGGLIDLKDWFVKNKVAAGLLIGVLASFVVAKNPFTVALLLWLDLFHKNKTEAVILGGLVAGIWGGAKLSGGLGSFLSKFKGLLFGARTLPMQLAADTMILAARNMQIAADTMAGASLGGGKGGLSKLRRGGKLAGAVTEGEVIAGTGLTARIAATTGSLFGAEVGAGILSGVGAALVGVGFLIAASTNPDSWWSKHVVQWADDITGWISRKWNGLVSWFSNIGHKIIHSFLQSASAGEGSVKQFFNNLTDHIADWKGPPARDAMLLHSNGQLIMGGLIKGLTSQVPALKRTLAGVSQTIGSGVAASPYVSATTQPLNVHVHVAPGGSHADVGKAVVQSIKAFQRSSGHVVLAHTP